MTQVKFKKGRIPFEKLRDLLESGLEGEEFELPEVICSNSVYYLYKLHHYGISDTWSMDLISQNTRLGSGSMEPGIRSPPLLGSTASERSLSELSSPGRARHFSFPRNWRAKSLTTWVSGS